MNTYTDIFGLLIMTNIFYFDTEDTYPDSEHQIVSMYQCTNKKCESWYEVYTHMD
jgi:hypothetical protein